jgi:hypothetical protein
MIDRVNSVIQKAWLQGFRTKSNFARLYADEVAIAASLGLISTKIGKEKFDKTWHITRKGLDYIGE